MSKPIEAILKSFIRHVVHLQNEDEGAGAGFVREFRILRETQIENKNEDRFPMEDGRKEENIKKNRYKDILPRDDRRVKLKEIPGEPGSDYINASFIDDVDGRRGYIAAQGPMPHTVIDFWRMLWQYKTEIVFMACRLKEDGKAKCEKYWAEKGESTMFGNITVQTVSEEEIQDHFIRRQLRVEKKGVVHKITHFQYVGWPDHNVPSSPDALRCMIEDVRNHRKHMNVPMVVHCSAGCGRTGTICAIDFAWTLLDKGMVTKDFSMFEIIKTLREQRMSMVQTPDQYEYTHMVMKSLCNEWLATFAKNDYENITLGDAAASAEEPEECYYNVAFHPDQSSSRDPRNSKEATPQNSKPAVNKKPDIKSQKPEITKPKLDVGAQKPDVPKHKPQGWPKSHATTTTSDANNSREHAVRQPVSKTPSSPSVLHDQKNQRSAVQQNPFFQGDVSVLKISKSGTTGRSAVKMKTRPQVGQSVGLHQNQDTEEEGSMYAVVDKNTKKNQQASAPLYENHHMPVNRKLSLPDTSYANERYGGDSRKESPGLPSRNYKPEELSTGSSKPLAPRDKSPKPQQNYDNVMPTSQPQSQTAAAPFSKGNLHRAQQPTPLSHPAPKSATHTTRAPQPISPRNARPQGQAVGDSSSATSGGQPASAISSRQNVSQPRPGWVDSTPPSHSPVKRDFPGIFRGVAAPPQSAPPHSQPGGAQKHIVAAPGPGQVLQAGSGRPVFVLERVPRVRGPRPWPPAWNSNTKGHKGAYL